MDFLQEDELSAAAIKYPQRLETSISSVSVYKMFVYGLQRDKELAAEGKSMTVQNHCVTKQTEPTCVS